MAGLKVGIVGAGNVGSKLGAQLASRGAAVKYGARDPASDKVKAVLAAQPAATADTVDATVSWADALILAVPGSNGDEGIKATAASLGPNVKGKVIIDATNPLTAYPGLDVRWSGKSGGEVLAEALPDSFVYKAFNTIGDNQMDHPDGSAIGGQQLTMLLAGPQDKLDVAEKVVAGVGFVPMYVGSIRYARNLEAIAELWIHLGVPGVGTSAKWGRNFHFQAIRAPQ